MTAAGDLPAFDEVSFTGRADGGADAGADGGADGSADGNAGPGVDGGADGGADGHAGPGADGGADGSAGESHILSGSEIDDLASEDPQAAHVVEAHETALSDDAARDRREGDDAWNSAKDWADDSSVPSETSETSDVSTEHLGRDGDAR